VAFIIDEHIGMTFAIYLGVINELEEKIMLLLKNCEVYAPEYMGKKDILMSGGSIELIADSLEDYAKLPEIEVLECEGKIAFPGFIDSHVHICGAGGEGGFKTRTPEIKMTDLTVAGVTTVIGLLGTDGIGRSMENLVSKAKGLKEEGISAYVFTGSYQVPVRTLTGEIMKDITMIDEIIGVGEIAISDHRSSQPMKECVTKLVADARVGGLLSGKAGVVHFHLGSGTDRLKMLNEIIEETELPITQFYPTHVNAYPELFECAVDFAKKGGYIDFTTSTTPYFIATGEVKAAEALKICLEKGVSKKQITFSSDAQGSLPCFDENGKLEGLLIGKASSLYESVREAIMELNVDVEDAIRVITENPASVLKLENKGRIKNGMDGDVVLVDNSNYEIETVISRGTIMYSDSKHVIGDTF